MSRHLSPVSASRLPNPTRGSIQTSPTKLSFSERKAQKENMTPSSEGSRHLMRDISRPPPGDVTRSGSNKTKPGLASRRSNINFFEDAFSVGESSAAKERVRGDAIVLAEVKTNVIVSFSHMEVYQARLTWCVDQ